MTVPAQNVAPAAPEPAAPALPAAPLRVPMQWLLDHGSWPVRVRALLELAPGDGTRAAASAAYAYEPALRLAMQQHRDGTWGTRILSVPPPDDPNFTGVGTIPAVRRLLEYGWELNAPPFLCAKRILFRLLAEDTDPEFLFELRSDTRGDDEYLVRRGRLVLREAAAATLAQLGYEADPRLRGAAVRMLDRVATYVRATLTAQQSDGDATKPAADPKEPLPANAAPPSAHLLVMLAHMPRFRSEHQDEIAKLGTYLAAAPTTTTLRQILGKQAVDQPQLVLGDPLVGAVAGTDKSAALPTTLAWLEVFARIGYLKTNAAWSRLLDTLLAERDSDGLWKGRPATFGPSTRAWDWPTYPLGDPSIREHRVADMTFRLALIARLAGRTLDLA